MAISPYDYHSGLQGSYQYLTLKEVVTQLQFAYSDDDHYLKHTRRSRIVTAIKDVIREVSKKTFTDLKVIEMTVPETLYIDMPHNFVNYKGLHLVLWDEGTSSYRLKPIDINQNINISDEYLQDNDGAILFDNEGRVLTGDVLNAYGTPYKKYYFDTYSDGGNQELDTSKLSKYGECAIDRKNGRIAFSSDLSDKNVVLMYTSDGLEFDTYGEEEIKVHKDSFQLIKDRVYFNLIEGKRNVPANEKQRAKLQFKTSAHQAALNNIDIQAISKALNIKTKSI